LLYADGCNFTPKQTVSISLEEGDRHILESFRNELNYNKELEYIDYSNKHDFGYTYRNQYRLLIFSKHISEELEKKGVKHNKSLILEFPDFIPDNLLKFFILGYFDGDGSFCPHYTTEGKFQPLITFTSTKNFCISLQTYLRNKLNIPCGNIYDAMS
jgi:intein/homing endonuclease